MEGVKRWGGGAGGNGVGWGGGDRSNRGGRGWGELPAEALAQAPRSHQQCQSREPPGLISTRC